MKRLVLYPYKVYSSSAKKIQEVLGGLRVLPDGKYKPKLNDCIINWGCSSVPAWLGDRPILNHPNKTKVAINKLSCFSLLKDGGVLVPDFTTNKEEVVNWNKTVVRKVLTGNSGKGIVLVQKGEDIPDAPLYVKYKKKRKEFRVHVFKGEVIDVLEKRKRKVADGETPPDPYIRSHLNGWVFCRENITEPDDLRATSIKAMEVLGLDFGGIDIVWNEQENKCYVLEVNTAPGIEGTSVTHYCERIKACLNM